MYIIDSYSLKVYTISYDSFSASIPKWNAVYLSNKYDNDEDLMNNIRKKAGLRFHLGREISPTENIFYFKYR